MKWCIILFEHLNLALSFEVKTSSNIIIINESSWSGSRYTYWFHERICAGPQWWSHRRIDYPFALHRRQFVLWRMLARHGGLDRRHNLALCRRALLELRWDTHFAAEAYFASVSSLCDLEDCDGFGGRTISLCVLL